ncbi:TIGR04197 family type VII secretion effector [Streptococcus acidominimus]|uniref:TIGR04197 family type VII secretion effector n=1 Tax=Streptococcus acidominimus TaxID=1326 RepID=A0A4Y9FLS1_STRAI|nr:TIGR04197 family type VII secretion effector [Streptococcus acidominimus]MBF0819296.1 TIGR04197 family type VII secretion effector [Streptococcus acidominimus]MBF0839640.1 TIGR04197 family type VII secretion effector [Streptococcus acidominimus]MBF0848982.1 TIGR04197 family type VII secretion effector [Streptococcus danieliae]TFU30081.1 TIGR04197 family type VII secretion effector [Streptococcus acidominimus]
MEKGEIKSSTIAAQEAISRLVDIDVSARQNQQVEFGYSSGITGMENARQVTKQILQAVSQFTAATLAQATKFPDIAQKIAKQDLEEAKRWEK